jgi:hypothetical protein
MKTMGKLDTRIENEVQSLVKDGARHLRNAQSLSESMAGDDLVEVTSWVTRLGQLIRRLYGEESQHFKSYSSALATTGFYNLHGNWNSHFSQMVGVARTIQHDLNNGLLADFEALVQADIFSDFLEMGEYLLQEGYKDAAAVIVGSVLEDGLRKLAERSGIPTTSGSGKPLTIDPLNTELAGQKIYSKLVQKQITSWAHIRNKAAHGEFSEYSREQVQMMLLFVQNFAAEYLG